MTNQPSQPNTPEPRVWTRDEREAAAKKICFAGSSAGLSLFERHPVLAFKIAVEMQCELTAALSELNSAKRELTELKREVMSENFKSNILRVTASPVTQGVWKLYLECGHAPWTSSERKPSGAIVCPVCKTASIISKLKSKAGTK